MDERPSSFTGLTLVVPTYNRADLIGQTIDSALSQTEPFERIIVVDNGSTDDTARVLAGFGRRVESVVTANIGVQRARNLGVERAETSHVVLCDSDDLLLPPYAAAVRATLQAHPDLQALYGNFCNFSQTREWPDKFSQAPQGWFDGANVTDGLIRDVPDLYVRMLSFQPLFPSGSAFSIAFYQQLGGYDARFNRVGAEDWEFALRVVAAGKVGLLTNPLIRIRRHDGNDSANAPRMAAGEATILQHALREHAAAQPWRAQIEADIAHRWGHALDGYFAQGDWAAARHAVQQGIRPMGWKLRIKALAVNAPPALQPALRRVLRTPAGPA